MFIIFSFNIINPPCTLEYRLMVGNCSHFSLGLPLMSDDSRLFDS